MNEYRYIFEKKGKKHICPSCNQRTFVMYIDTVTGELLLKQYGKCDRAVNCGYEFDPYKDGYSKMIWERENSNIPNRKPYKPLLKLEPIKKPASFIPVEVFKASLKRHEANCFVKFLIKLFGFKIASELISRYFIASSKHWTGATVFWQIDIKGKIRTGKIMLYNPATGKRIKEPFKYITWAHKVLKVPEFELKQCLYGEHLLSDNSKPVAIVESEKTAIIASVYLPQFIWLAVGSLTNLQAEKCSVLAGRNVSLFPDLNCFDKWNNKAKELSNLATFTVSDLLERKATDAEKQQGLDLADYLLRFDYREFTDSKAESEKQVSNKPEIINEYAKPLNLAIDDEKPIAYKVNFKPFRNEFAPLWDMTALEAYFDSLKLPIMPIQINNCTQIGNVKNFIDSHNEIIKNNNGNPTFLPYLMRLQEMKRCLETA